MTKQTVQDLCEFWESYAATEQRKKLQQWKDVKNYLFLSISLSLTHTIHNNKIPFSLAFFRSSISLLLFQLLTLIPQITSNLCSCLTLISSILNFETELITPWFQIDT